MKKKEILTFHHQIYVQLHLRLGVYLALVQPLIFHFDIGDEQAPICCVDAVLVVDFESRVGGERRKAGSQYLKVGVANPEHHPLVQVLDATREDDVRTLNDGHGCGNFQKLRMLIDVFIV